MYYGVFEESSVERVRLPSTLKKIEYCAFEDCKNLRRVTLPDELEYIGDWCFCGSGLEDTMIPKGVKSIGDCAFKDSALEKIAVDIYCQANVKSVVDNNVLVQAVREATVPYGTRTITEDQFSGRNVYRVFIPKSVEKIEDSAFEGCENLKEILFEEGSKLRTIGEQVFYKCKNLVKINLPEGLTSIGHSAFNSSGLESIVLPTTLKRIEDYTFNECKCLKNISLPEKLEYIG